VLFIGTNYGLSEDFIDPTVLYQSTSVIEDIDVSVDQEKVYVFARTSSPEENEIIVLISDDSGYSWRAPIILSNSTDTREKDNLVIIQYDNSTLYVYYLIYSVDQLFIGGNLYEPVTDIWVSLPERSLDSVITSVDYSSLVLRGTTDMISLIWYNQKQINCASSVDHGDNWVTSTLLKYSTTFDWIFARAVTFSNGVSLLSAVGTRSSYPDSCNTVPTSLILFRSTDYGKTWKASTIASYATFPCCGDTRDISPVLTSNSAEDLDLLFFLVITLIHRVPFSLHPLMILELPGLLLSPFPLVLSRVSLTPPLRHILRMKSNFTGLMSEDLCGAGFLRMQVAHGHLRSQSQMP